ncbi:MAG: sensor histidine kinase [Candidatus Methylomirabilales bacterium]
MDRFQELVQDLLEISRIDAGAGEVVAEPVRAGELVRHAVRASRRPTATVEVAADTEDLVVSVDKRRLERVLANLVDNAETHGAGIVRVAVERAGGAVRVVVDDAGPGVGEAERERIFERFVRGAAAGRRGHGEGTGLGLSLVMEHVRRHDGRVWVEDRPGGGARFVVELPLAAV